MKEYIEREALFKKVLEERRFVFQMEDLLNHELVVRTVYNDFAEFVNSIPAADVVERKRGEWVEWYPPKHMIMTGEELLFRCSCCDAKYSNVEGYRYCPYCGADMREVTE